MPRWVTVGTLLLVGAAVLVIAFDRMKGRW